MTTAASDHLTIGTTVTLRGGTMRGVVLEVLNRSRGVGGSSQSLRIRWESGSVGIHDVRAVTVTQSR